MLELFALVDQVFYPGIAPKSELSECEASTMSLEELAATQIFKLGQLPAQLRLSGV